MLILVHAPGGADAVHAFLSRLAEHDISADVALLTHRSFPPEQEARLRQAHADGVFFVSDLPGPSLKDAMRFAHDHGYDAVIEAHADVHDAYAVSLLASRIDAADVAIAVVPVHPDRRRSRHTMRRIADRFSRLVLRVPVREYGNGLYAYSKDAVFAIARLEDDVPVSPVSIRQIAYALHMKSGLRVREVSVLQDDVVHTHPLSPREFLALLLSILRIRYPQAALHLEQAVKFGLTGLAGAVIDISSLTLLVEGAGMDPVIAFFASSLLAICFIFFANKYFTFKGAKRGTTRQLLKFILVYGVAIGLNTGLSALFLWVGLHYLLAKTTAILLVAFFNYFFLHSFVFLREE